MRTHERSGRFLALIFGLLGLLLSYQNCGQTMKSKPVLDSSSRCFDPAFLRKTSFIERPQKLNIQENEKVDSNGAQLKTDSEVILEEGRKFIALIDESCAQSWPTSWSAKQIVKTPGAEPIMRAYPITLTSDTPISELSDLIEADPCVLKVSENTTLVLSSLPNDPALANNTATHFNSIKASEGYTEMFDKRGGIQDDVIVAVIDTGVQLQHPDLVSNLWVNQDEIPNNGRDDDGNGYVDDIHGWNFIDNTNNPNPAAGEGNKHGTHVAGLIAAVGNNAAGTAGINYTHAKIMSLNVFGNTITSSGEALVSAIYYAAANGAKIINMSLSTYDNVSVIEDAIADVVRMGVLVVAASGNDGIDSNTRPGYPAYYTKSSFTRTTAGVISVGATSPTGAKCSFSNFAPNAVDIGAPGCGGCGTSSCNGIYSTFINPDYSFLSGTSMATPIVAGAASLIYLKLKKLGEGYEPSAADIKTVLINSDIKFTTQSTPFRNQSPLNLQNIGAYLNTVYTFPPSNPQIGTQSCP